MHFRALEQSKSKSKSNGHYASIESEEESSLLVKSTEYEPDLIKPTQQKIKSRSSNLYFSLLTNRMFLFFVICIFSSIATFIWWFLMIPNDEMPYIVSGILGICVSINGYRHFKTVISLMKAIDKFHENNKKFRAEHAVLKEKVDELISTNEQLKYTEDQIRLANTKNLRNLENFRQVQSFMKNMDMKDLKSITAKATAVRDRWHTELMRKERGMLHYVFDRFEISHHEKMGMTEHEFNRFADSLPKSYKNRFARLGTFRALSNNDSVLEYADFEIVLDTFAEMKVDDVDIAVKITKIPKSPRKMVECPVTSLTMMDSIPEEPSRPSKPSPLLSPIVISPPPVSAELSEQKSDNIDEEEWNKLNALTKLETWRSSGQRIRKRQKAGQHLFSRELTVLSRTPGPSQQMNLSWMNIDDKFMYDVDENGDVLTPLASRSMSFDWKLKYKAKKKHVNTVSHLNKVSNVDAIFSAELDDTLIDKYMKQTSHDYPDES